MGRSIVGIAFLAASAAVCMMSVSSWAAGGTGAGAHERRGAGALIVPERQPAPDAAHAHLYRYEPAPDSTPAPDGAAGAARSSGVHEEHAQLAVVGTVLPVITIVVPAPGEVTQVVANTSDRDPRRVMFAARRSLDATGAAVRIDPATWRAARAALRRASAGTGTIWRAR